METVAEWIMASERVIVFTGAGISTESGIQDSGGTLGAMEPGGAYIR
jgi:NAD-dependent SIR2 family protein deacetylase